MDSNTSTVQHGTTPPGVLHQHDPQPAGGVNLPQLLLGNATHGIILQRTAKHCSADLEGSTWDCT